MRGKKREEQCVRSDSVATAHTKERKQVSGCLQIPAVVRRFLLFFSTDVFFDNACMKKEMPWISPLFFVSLSPVAAVEIHSTVEL